MLRKKAPEPEGKKANANDGDLSWDLSTSFKNGTSKNAIIGVSSRDVIFTKRSSPASAEEAWNSTDQLKPPSTHRSSRDESWSWKPDEKNISYLTDYSNIQSGRFSEESSKPVERAIRLKVTRLYNPKEDSSSESGSVKFSEESSAEVLKRKKGQTGPQYPDKLDLIESIEWKDESESINEFANTQRELLDIFEMEEQRIKRKADRLNIGVKSPKLKKNDSQKPALKVHFEDDLKKQMNHSNSLEQQGKNLGLQAEEISLEGQNNDPATQGPKYSVHKMPQAPGTIIPKIIKKGPASNMLSPVPVLPKAIEVIPKGQSTSENDFTRILDDLNKTTEMLDAISSIKKPTTRLPSIKKKPVAESLPSLPSQDEIPVVSFDALSADKQASMVPEPGDPSSAASQPKPATSPISVMKKPTIRLPGTKVPAIIVPVGGTTSRSTDSPLNKDKDKRPTDFNLRSLNPLEPKLPAAEPQLAATMRHDPPQNPTLGLTGLESLQPGLRDEDTSMVSQQDLPTEHNLSWDKPLEQPVAPLSDSLQAEKAPQIPPLEHVLLGKAYQPAEKPSEQSILHGNSRELSLVSGQSVRTFADEQSRIFGGERRSVVSGISEYEPLPEEGIHLADLSEESSAQINVPIQFHPPAIRAKIDHSIYGVFTPGAKLLNITPRIEEVIHGIFTQFKYNQEGLLEIKAEDDSMDVEGSEATPKDTNLNPFPSQGYRLMNKLKEPHDGSKSHIRDVSIDRQSGDSIGLREKLRPIRPKPSAGSKQVSQRDINLLGDSDTSVYRDKVAILRSTDQIEEDIVPTGKILLMLKEHPKPKRAKGIEPCFVKKVDFWADVYSIERVDGDEIIPKNADDSLELIPTKAALKIEPQGIWYKRLLHNLSEIAKPKAKEAEEIGLKLGVPFEDIASLAAKGMAKGELYTDELCRRDGAIRNFTVKPASETHEALYIIYDPVTKKLTPIETDEGGSILPGYPGANMLTIKDLGNGDPNVTLNEELQLTVDENGRYVYLLDPYTGKPIRPGANSNTRITTDHDSTINDPLNQFLLNRSTGLKSPRRNRYEELNEQSLLSDADKTRILALPEEPRPKLNRSERQKYVYYKDPRKPIRMVQKFEVPKPRPPPTIQDTVARAKSVGRSAMGEDEDLDFDETRINNILDQPLFNQRPDPAEGSRTSRKKPIQYRSVKYPHLAKMLAQMMVEKEKSNQNKRVMQYRSQVQSTLELLHNQKHPRSRSIEAGHPNSQANDSEPSVTKSVKLAKQKVSEEDLHEWYGTTPESHQAKYERNNKYNVLAHSNNPQYLYSQLYKSYYQEFNDNRPGVKEKIEEIEKKEREKFNINTNGSKMYITFDERKLPSAAGKQLGQPAVTNN